MKYHPLKILLFSVIVLLTLYGLTYFSQRITYDNGMYEEGFFINGVGLKYPTSETFFSEKGIEDEKEKSIDELIQNIEDVIPDTIEKDDISSDQKLDSIQIPKPKVVKILNLKKIDTSKIIRIDYPKNKMAFISEMDAFLNGENWRIIHYGDSQLEGDRISAYLRHRLQKIYGGTGPGFIPIVQAYENISSDVSHSKNWLRYAYFDPTTKRFDHKKYGVFNSISRFTEGLYDVSDSLNLDHIPISKASIQIFPSTKSYASNMQYTKIGLHYGNSITPTSIKVYQDNNLITQDSLINDGKYHNYQLLFQSTPQNLRYEFEGKISPDFYGLTLDGQQGVALDNVAMRGGSGLVFATLDATNFKAMSQNLDPKLFIFQYGGNSIPYIKDSLEVRDYARYMKNHIKWVSRRSPKAKILFVGPSDMSTSINGNMQTYPLLPYLNKVLREEMNKNGIAYWSMYDAMGGKNSMPYWVEQKLAATDYTHFAPSGTKIISEHLFLALYLDLNQVE